MKKIFSLSKKSFLFVGMMALSLSASAQDNRTEVNEFTATSNIAEIMVYGHQYERPKITMAEGSVAYFPSSMTDIRKKDESGNWQAYYSTISEGTYKITAQLRIDGENGTIYKFGEGVKLKVDGVEWTIDGIAVRDTYSYCAVSSPEIVIEYVAVPLEFNNSSSFNIPMNYIGTAIKSYSVVDGVIGGEKPYTFSKTSGPEWVDVSADGTVSGTPNALGVNDDLVIRVTDNASEYKEITVTVGKTNINPADRTEVNEFTATSNIAEIMVYEHQYERPKITMAEGSVAYFPSSMTDIKKKDASENWQFYYSTISEGTYKIVAQLRIDGENGTIYKLGEGVKLKVDGVEWTTEGIAVRDTYSYCVVSSPEIVISQSGISQPEVSGEATVQEIYSMDGIKQPQLQHGLNIVRMSDGTIRKIIRK